MRNKILFVHSGNETFVKLDYQILKDLGDVDDLYAREKFPFGLTQYIHRIKKNDIIYCWFASWNSFWALLFSRLLNKPSLLVIGGYDVANLPNGNYGHQRFFSTKYFSRLGMILASEVITFSCFSQSEAKNNAGITNDRVKVVYLGVPDSIKELPDQKQKIVLSVGNVNRSNLHRKGHELFVRTAAFLPEIQFVLAGAWEDDAVDLLKSIAPENVGFTGRLSNKELNDHYKRASVYVQASQHEGFGMSVAEAMLAGCIPVVTRNGSLPEVVGDCGYYVDSPDPECLAKAIAEALKVTSNKRMLTRQRILQNFSIDKRKKQIEEIINSIL